MLEDSSIPNGSALNSPTEGRVQGRPVWNARVFQHSCVLREPGLPCTEGHHIHDTGESRSLFESTAKNDRTPSTHVISISCGTSRRTLLHPRDKPSTRN